MTRGISDAKLAVLSRRTILLRGVTCVAGAAALIGPAKNALAAKFPQNSPAVAYQSTPKDSPPMRRLYPIPGTECMPSRRRCY